MKKPYVIGIAGGSASGKSTFSDTLEKALHPLTVKVFHMDSYFKPREQRIHCTGPVSPVVYTDNNHPLSLDLPGLAKDLAEVVACNQVQVVVVEGLMTLQDADVLNQLDLKLFVDCRPEERVVRRIKRNMKWGETLDEITDVYLDLVRYRHDEFIEPTRWRADFVLNGSNPSALTLQMIVSWVNQIMNQEEVQ